MAVAEGLSRKSQGFGGLIASLSLCVIPAGLGGYWTSLGLGPWYDSLIKPSLNPPSSVFGPVWTTLYFMMAVAAWLVWRVRERSGANLALGLYAAQLVLNLAWPGIFFALRRPGLAFVEIVCLWLMIVATLVAFARVHKAAAALLVPYLLWVSFASALNFTFWRLNG